MYETYKDDMKKENIDHEYIENNPPAKVSQTEIKEEPEDKSMQELVERISTFISDEDEAERIKKLLRTCRDDRERRLLSFRYGLEDGIPKTFEETAAKFGISRERAMQIERKVVWRMIPHRKRSRPFADYLDG